MASELEGMSPEQQEQAARLFRFVKANPAIEKTIRREAKKANPSMAAPDIELEDALAAQEARFNERMAADQKSREEAEQVVRRASAHDRCREAGFEPADVEACMVKDNIANFDTAIRFMQAQKQLAPATHHSVSPMTMPDDKNLWKDKNQFARTTAFDAINDLRSGRVQLGR